ncbi:MAG: antitoxin [Terriglobales bacterium]
MDSKPSARAKVFWTGRSQAARLPKQSRLPGRELRVSRVGSGVLSEPLAEGWAWLDELSRPLDRDFAAAAEEQPPAGDRAELDQLWP